MSFTIQFQYNLIAQPGTPSSLRRCTFKKGVGSGIPFIQRNAKLVDFFPNETAIVQLVSRYRRRGCGAL